MRILVCMKQVPDSNEVKMKDDHTLERGFAAQIVNPADENALEAALQLRDTYGGSVSLLTMGHAKAESMLREALSRGADAAMLMTDPAFAGADTLVTASCLKACVEKTGPYDLILCGRRATDGETGQVGPMLAAMLDFPCVANAVRVMAEGDCMRIDQLTEKGIITWEAGFPAVITFCEGSYRLRLPTIKGLRRAQTVQIRYIKPANLDLSSETCGIKASPTRVVRVSANPVGIRNCIRTHTGDILDILKRKGVL